MKLWNLGYPYLGVQNQWAQAVQGMAGSVEKIDSFLEVGVQVLKSRWAEQHDLGVDSIPINDFCFFDKVLETAYLFNLIPANVDLSKPWSVCLKDMSQVLPQARWFHSPYLYYSPEWDPKQKLKLNVDKVEWELNNQKALPYTFHFALLGPWTLAQLCRSGKRSKSDLIQELIPHYVELLKWLKKKGISWVQLEEPGLCGNIEKKDIQVIEKAYEQMGACNLKLMLATYYDSPDPWLSELSHLPVQALHFDVLGGPSVLSWIKTRGFPKEKILCLGLVNALNIWRAPVTSLVKQIELLQGFHPASKLFLAPSGPLFHLPLSKDEEHILKAEADVFDNLSFAKERLQELSVLKRVLQGNEKVEPLQKAESELERKLQALQKPVDSVRNPISRIDFTFRKRASSITKRIKLQQKKLGLPVLPVTQTTPLGTAESIQQLTPGLDCYLPDATTEIEKLGEVALDWGGFRSFQNAYIHLGGMKWFRPPLILSDIEWREGKFTKSFGKWVGQSSPMAKGRALGPLTVLNYSFARSDLTTEQLLTQIALAVRKEVQKIESMGARVIQVDEPALGVGLPLKRQKHSLFWKSCLEAVKLALCGAKDETHVQYHIFANKLEEHSEILCKCDVDLISFGTEYGWEETFQWLKLHPMECALAPLFSEPVNAGIPTEKSIENFLRKVFEVVAPDKLWVSASSSFSNSSDDNTLAVIQRVITVTHLIRNWLRNK